MNDPAIFFVVVLTGGPGAGKSSCLTLLRQRLSVRGFQVITVPENATHFFANSDGFQREWLGTQQLVTAQRILLDYQLHQEDAFKKMAMLHPTKKRTVMLLDCCTVSGKAYVSDDQWQEVLSYPGKTRLTEKQLLQRYDLIVHLVTSAYQEGCERWWYNNPARFHDPAAAKEADAKCQHVFKAHPKQLIVPSCRTFEEKVDKVFNLIKESLHISIGGTRCRRSVHIRSGLNIREIVNKLHHAAAFVITSIFIG